MSPQRFVGLKIDAASLSVTVLGKPGETVLVGVTDARGGWLDWLTGVVAVTCSIGPGGSAVLGCGPGPCKCG